MCAYDGIGSRRQFKRWWINPYPLERAIVSQILIDWIVIYLVDSAIQRWNNWGQGGTSV